MARHDNDHDDFGGLHRDLRATGSAMNRRGLLRLAARMGVGAGALQLGVRVESDESDGRQLRPWKLSLMPEP